MIGRVFETQERKKGRILETQELVPKVYGTHKPIHLFIGSSNMKEYWDSELFCVSDGRICGVFRHFCDLYNSAQTCHFFYCTSELLFEAHLLRPLKIWQLWSLKSYKVFMEPLYTIVTPPHVQLNPSRRSERIT